GSGGGGGGGASANGTAGTANTGGGGGGSGEAGASGGAGGSGIVIVRYPLDPTFGTGEIDATGGTITNVGGNRIHTFTSNDVFSIISGDGKVDVLIVAGGGAGGGVEGTGVGCG